MKGLKDRNPGKWCAGHLLNDNLGGSGTSTDNLTPLTETANKQHRGYETHVKNFCDEADREARFPKTDSFWWGLEYSVTVAAVPFGTFAPYTNAPSHITIKASVVVVDRATGAISKPAPTQFKLNKPNYNFGPIEIHNRDAHLV